MELREYLKIFVARVWLFVATIIVVVGGTYVFTITRPQTYTGALTIYNVINADPQDISNGKFYEYDNFYSLEASKGYSDIIIAWLQDPSNVSQIYAQANKEIPAGNLKKFSQLIKATRIEPAAVEVFISSLDNDYVKSLLASTKQFVVNKNEDWKNKGMITDSHLDISEPIIYKDKAPILINLAIALVVGIILGLASVYLTEYLSKEK